jgi:hypothetical protein
MLRMRLPGNSWRTSSTAVPTPNSVFAITENMATCAVTLNACSAVSVVSESITGPMPSANVVQQMSPTGSTSRNSR